MNINLRTVRPEDLDAVASVEAAAFPTSEACPKDAFKKRIACFPECFLVAEVNGSVVGIINGSITNQKRLTDDLYEDLSLHDPQGAYQSVFGLAVLPDWRHQGIASALMNALIDTARSNGRKGIVLTCKDTLISFYKQFGYQCLGVSASVHGGAKWNDMLLEF